MWLRNCRLSCVWLGLALSAALPAVAEKIGFWPEAGEHSEPLDLDACEAHLLPAGEVDRELTTPCGTWVTPPASTLGAWLEGPDRMGEAPLLVEVPAQGPRRIDLPLAPAGKVRLAPSIEPGEGQVVRLLHLESHRRGGHAAPEMLRELRGGALRDGALMPEGPVLGLLFDTEKRRYVAVGPPVTARLGAVADVAPEPPERTDLLVVLERPEPVTDLTEYDVELGLRGGLEEARPPDVLIPAADRLYALWLDLPGSQATLETRSPSVYLPPQEIALRPRSLEDFRADLRPLPSVDAVFELPDALRSEKLALEVERLPGRLPVRTLELAPDARAEQLKSLPPAMLIITLHAPPWQLRQRVDLSDGADGTVVFAPQPILLSGTVYRGEEGYPATVALNVNLKSDKGQLLAETDEYGRYEAVLFRHGTYVAEVSLTDALGLPLFKIVEVPRQASFEQDFIIPDVSFRIQVIDAITGEGIPKALVHYDNREKAGGGVGQFTKADAEGWAEIAHLQPGSLELKASAPGYVLGGIDPLEVGNAERHEELTIALEPFAEVAWLRLYLPSGAPAAGAEVLAQAWPLGGLDLWGGQADENGRLAIPRHAWGSILLARHLQAASGVRRLAEEPDEDTSWHLAVPAPKPLTVVARTSRDEPAPWAPLALWLQGHRASGYALRWLTRSRTPTTDGSGFWQGSHLPQAPARLLVWTRGQDAAAASGALDNLAVDIPFPWSKEIEIRAIE